MRGGGSQCESVTSKQFAQCWLYFIYLELEYYWKQVQNKKLSERLKERNFARERLEARLEEAEGRVEEQRRALASLPRHMLALKAHLTPLLPDNTGLEVLERFKEESRPELSLEDGFRAALATLRQLVLGERGKGGEGGMEVPSETTAEVGRLEDENKALQSHCEDLESALADARCVCPGPGQVLTVSAPPALGLTWSVVSLGS